MSSGIPFHRAFLNRSLVFIRLSAFFFPLVPDNIRCLKVVKLSFSILIFVLFPISTSVKSNFTNASLFSHTVLWFLNELFFLVRLWHKRQRTKESRSSVPMFQLQRIFCSFGTATDKPKLNLIKHTKSVLCLWESSGRFVCIIHCLLLCYIFFHHSRPKRFSHNWETAGVPCRFSANKVFSHYTV